MRQELTVVLAVVFFEGCVTLVYGLIHPQHVLHQSRPFQADAQSRVGVIEVPFERVALLHVNCFSNRPVRISESLQAMRMK